MNRAHTGQHKTAKRIAALAVLVCFVVFAAGAVAFAAGHIQHHCTGSHCETCLLLGHVQQFFKQLFAAGAAALLVAAVAALRVFFAAQGVPTPVCTLASLKVQLNN